MIRNITASLTTMRAIQATLSLLSGGDFNSDFNSDFSKAGPASVKPLATERAVAPALGT
jgi:hypothetical protein